jgi:hypothetical protein
VPFAAGAEGAGAAFLGVDAFRLDGILFKEDAQDTET